MGIKRKKTYYRFICCSLSRHWFVSQRKRSFMTIGPTFFVLEKLFLLLFHWVLTKQQSGLPTGRNTLKYQTVFYTKDIGRVFDFHYLFYSYEKDCDSLTLVVLTVPGNCPSSKVKSRIRFAETLQKKVDLPFTQSLS